MTTENRFGHDPTDTDSYTGEDVHPFEDVNERASREGYGMGYVLSRHDGLLVVELDDVMGPMGLYTKAGRIIDALGETYREVDQDNQTLLRSLYFGSLPGSLHGGSPVTIRADDGPNSFAIRMYDRGWFPVYGPGDGFDNEIEEVNENALHRILSIGGVEWDDE